MLVYRNQAELMRTEERVRQVRSLIFESAEGQWDHARVTELLLEFGELEAGIADALAPQKDGVHPTMRALREASLLAGHAYFHSWRDTGAASDWVSRFASAFQRVIPQDLPERITVSVPEGYAYYSLYPEMYLQAAERFFEERNPQHAVVIGIRSIGTSASAIAGAALEEHGCGVDAYTVRPRGHPFDRFLALETALADEWRSNGDAFFLVVDEGPGLSGSSFSSVTQELGALGIPSERIILFPSWLPEATDLVSATARAEWIRYNKYVASFEQVELESGQLPISPRESRDLSAGQWRSLFYPDAGSYPAVHPHHERRKYLRPAEDGTEHAVLFKFAGLGRYGKARLARAEQLAQAGLAPRPHGLHNGFLAMEWVQGQPLVASHATPDLLDTLARYLAFLQRKFVASPGVGFDELMEMIRVNVAEGLPQETQATLGKLDKCRSILADTGATALDGRMLPHEWLAMSNSYIKTDNLDHHDDHFLPGCQNIAWDLAGALIEFDLSAGEQTYLLDRYSGLAGDRNVAERLPFYLIAYLAFRLGYAVMASKALASAIEGHQFRRLSLRYAERLDKEIERL